MGIYTGGETKVTCAIEMWTCYRKAIEKLDMCYRNTQYRIELKRLEEKREAISNLLKYVFRVLPAVELTFKFQFFFQISILRLKFALKLFTLIP